MKYLVALLLLAIFIVIILSAINRVSIYFSKDLGVVDRVVVDKSDRKLILYREDQEVAQYPISLGGNPNGHKQQEGDSKTPEGQYLLDWRNPNSRFFKSIHISYPNTEDKKHAESLGVSAGGDIMIHGLPNGIGWLDAMIIRKDWTDGCIALTNKQMEEVWNSVPNGTPILIKP